MTVTEASEGRGASAVSRTPLRRGAVSGRRQAAVVGSPRLRRSASAARPPGVDLVALAGPADLQIVCTLNWDEILLDATGLAALRRSPVPLRDRCAVVVPDDDAGTVRRHLLEPFGRWAAAKRGVDVLLATALLLALLPLLAVAVLAILLDTRGAPIFAQDRVGRGGRTFRCYKLRSMHVGGDDTAHRRYSQALLQGEAERVGGLFKIADDPRVTRVGRLLRRSSVDELPQLWNVLRGDMSLVGPRPLLPSDADLFTAAQWGRLRVKPGLTGLWQISGRSALSFEQMVALDCEYWRSWTPRRDLLILLSTPRAVLATRRTA
jgi:lipopolysaccharide/colanic/teichoic acid biosynthesis glycosyltransferase